MSRQWRGTRSAPGSSLASRARRLPQAWRYYITGGVDVEAQITAARAHVDAAAFDAAMETGKAQPLADAVALALGEDQPE